MQAQAERLRILADERVLSRQLLLLAPCRRRRADSAQVLQQVPEAGDGVPLCGRHKLSRQRRGRWGVAAAGGAVGGLPGLEQAGGQLAAAAIHGCQSCQADSVPNSGVHASRVAHEPELLPGGLLAAQLSSQGGPHGGGHRLEAARSPKRDASGWPSGSRSRGLPHSGTAQHQACGCGGATSWSGGKACRPSHMRRSGGGRFQGRPHTDNMREASRCTGSDQRRLKEGF